MADLGTEMKNGGTWATPVFWFLKGVEGFDTSRADDCARKLNEKHYDTIAVLKLAEKRDLVEDAGILPGDALRIVVAARAYVPPCGPPFRPVKRYQKHPRPSEPPTPQEHHQDAITVAVEQLQKAYQAACSLTPSSRASDSTSLAVQPQQQPAGASQSTSPKHSDSWGSDLTLRAIQLGAPASIFQAVPQQPPPGTSYSTFRASPQHKGAADSQQVAPKAEAVKDLTVPLPSTIQAFPHQQPRALDSIIKTAPQQQEPKASDPTLQAVPQQQQQPKASHLTFQAVPQQHKGTAVSQQGSPKSEAVKDPTVPLLSTVEAFPQEQPRASEDSTFKPAIPQQQQQQPGASDSVPQQPPPKASDSTLLSVPQQEQQQQQASNFHESFEAALRELEASFEACIQQLHVQLHKPRDSESRARAIPRQQQTGVSNSNSQAVPQQQKGTAVSQLVAPKSEAVKDPTSAPLPSIIQAVPQQQPPPKATNSTQVLSVPQQQQARASDPSIVQVSLQASPQEQNASFQANLQQLHSAADSQQAAPNPEAVKGPSVPLPSTIQAFPSQQPPRAADSTFKTVPQQQQQARASDPKLQASLQEQNASCQAYVQEQSASFLAYVQQLHGGEVSQQVAPKSEAVKNPTVPLPSTFQAVSQQQTRASSSTAQAVPQQQQQQQPGASPSTLQAVPQQQAKASDSTAQASPQQQPKASVFNSQTFPQQQARASDSTAQSVPQQQPRASDSTAQSVPQQQPRASDSASQAVSQQQIPWGPPLGDDHPPRAPISAIQAPPQQQKPQKSYEENCTGHHGSSQKDNHSGGVGPFGVIPLSLVKYPHICRICNVMCINENQYITHYSCQRHYEALDLQRRSPPQQPHSEHPPRSGDRTPEHVCGVCDIWCRSEFDLRSHFDGNKHAKNMKLAIDSKDNRHTTYLNCSICDVLCNSKWNLVQHLNGKRHALNMEEDSEDDYSEGSSYYSENS